MINDLNGEEITGIFYEKEFQKTSPEKYRIEKVLKRKGDKLYVKWKGYDSLGELLTLKLIFPNMQQKLKKVWGKY